MAVGRARRLRDTHDLRRLSGKALSESGEGGMREELKDGIYFFCFTMLVFGLGVVVGALVP